MAYFPARDRFIPGENPVLKAKIAKEIASFNQYEAPLFPQDREVLQALSAGLSSGKIVLIFGDQTPQYLHTVDSGLRLRQDEQAQSCVHVEDSENGKPILVAKTNAKKVSSGHPYMFRAESRMDMDGNVQFLIFHLPAPETRSAEGRNFIDDLVKIVIGTAAANKEKVIALARQTGAAVPEFVPA